MDGWETAGGGGRRGGGEQAGDIHTVCRGGCNRSIAEAEVVAGEGNRRNGLRFPGGAPRWSQTPSCGAVQIPRGPRKGNCQTPGPTWDRLTRRAGQTWKATKRTFASINYSLAQSSTVADSVMGALIPRLHVRHPAMSFIDRDGGRRGRRGLSCGFEAATRRHPVASGKGGCAVACRRLTSVLPERPDLFQGCCMEAQRNLESMM